MVEPTESVRVSVKQAKSNGRDISAAIDAALSADPPNHRVVVFDYREHDQTWFPRLAIERAKAHGAERVRIENLPAVKPYIAALVQFAVQSGIELFDSSSEDHPISQGKSEVQEQGQLVRAPPTTSEKKREILQIDDLSLQRRGVIIDFLFDAENRGLLDRTTSQNLLDFLDQPALAPAPADESPTVAIEALDLHLEPAVIATPDPIAQSAEVEVPVPARPIDRPGRQEPGPWAVWKTSLGKVGEAVVSDLALHGFVYLGVLLTFVGVFGFLFFAFQDVPDSAQPLVELAIPLIFFVWAWALRRRHAVLIAKGMELLGGLVLPIVVIAGLVDNAPIPPDFRGRALIAAMVTASLLIAFAYAWWSGRHQDSALAYLVAPMIWLAGFVLGFIFKTDEALQGVAITHLVSFQPALASTAITATLAAVALPSETRLARPTTLAAIPAVAVAYLLSVGLSANEGWVHPVPVLLAGVTTLISVELLGYLFAQSKVVSALRPLLLAAALAPLIPMWGLAWAGVAVVVGYLGLLELDLKTGEAAPWSRPVALAGAVAGLAISVLEPWAMVVSWAVASIWTHTRRIVRLPSLSAGSSLDVAAAVVPIGLGLGLVRALPDDVAWLVMSVVVVAVVVAARWLGSEDRFWSYWPSASASAVAVGAAATWYLDRGGPTSVSLRVASITLAAAVLAASSLAPALKVWVTSGALALALAVGMDGANVVIHVRPIVWALVGLAAVVAAAARRRGVAAHLGLVGHLVGLGSLVSASRQRLAGVLGAWTVGWLATVVAGELGGRTVTELLQKTGRQFASRLGERLEIFGRSIPPIVLAASAPFAVLQTAGLSEAFAQNRAWSGVALGMLAIVYAVFARGMTQRKPLSSVLGSGAVVLSLIAVAVAAPEAWESIVTAATSIVVAGLLAGELRKPAFTWFAWTMSFVLVVLVAGRLGVTTDSLDLVALGWGGLLLIGGLVVDDLRAGRRQPGEGLRIAWVRHPVVLGALAVPLSLGPTFSQAPEVFGWWSLGTAGAYFVVAYLLRVGAVTGPAYALTAVAITVLYPDSPMSLPWLFVPIAAALVGCSFVAARARSADHKGWLRWDLPPLVVAHLVAGVALARAAQVDMVPSTAIGLGLLSVAVGLWRRNRIWAEAGNILLLLGAAGLGPGWLALALLATSIRAVLSAILTTGGSRVSFQVMAAVAAGWSFVQTVVWQGWSVPEAVSVASLVFGGLAAIVGLLLRFARLGRDWAATWGGLASVGVVLTTVAAPGSLDGWGPATGMALFALGLGLAARPLGLKALEVSATIATGVAWLELVAGARWNTETAVISTSLAAGSLALLVAFSARLLRLSRRWAASWGLLTLVALVVISPLAVVLNRSVAGMTPAFGLGLFAIGSAVATRPLGDWLHYLSVAITTWAWVILVLGVGWSIESTAVWTAVIFGGLSVVVVEVMRRRQRHPAPDSPLNVGVARAWAGVSGTGVVVATLLAVDSVERRSAWLVIGLSMALLAIAASRAAIPLQWPWVRETSGLVALSAVTATAYGLGANPSGIALGAMTLGIVATVLLLTFGQSQGFSPWLRPLIIAGTVAGVEALLFAIGLLPQRGVLVAVLTAFGVQAIAAGLVLQRPTILSVGPPLISIGWLGIAAESFMGSAQWFTAPIAVTLLAEVEIARWSRRQGRQGLSPGQVRLLELAGIGLLVLSPLAEMFTGGIFFGLLAFGYAAVVLIWAVVTRVRRRVVTALVLATVAAALTISAAAASAAPTSAFLWIFAAGAGLAVMLSIGIVESYRSRSGAIMHRLDVLMEGWE